MVPITLTFPADSEDVVLLVHGLTGTPNEMRVLAKGLRTAGYAVHCITLPGHCGTMDDLLATRWQDWYGHVEQVATALRLQSTRLFVGGLSMGALLALALAARHPDWISGVAVYGPTFRYDGWSIPWTGKLAFLLPLLLTFGIGRRRVFMEPPPYGIRDAQLRQRVSAAMLAGDSVSAGLPGNPWPALAEMQKLSAWTRRQLGAVTSPCLVMHARHDDVASLRNAELVVSRVAAETRLIVLENSYHMITVDQERRAVIDASVAFFDSQRRPGPAMPEPSP
jgi:carboxylesterase